MTAGHPSASRRRRWLLIALVVLGIAALAFAIGRFSTFGAAGPALPGDDSPEAGFSRDMQVHHAQAVEMAMELYRKTEDAELLVLSYDIATGQAAQRGEMYDWLVKWGLPQGGGIHMAWMADASAGHGDHDASGDGPLSEAEAREAMGMASDAELAALRDADGLEADCLFLDLMIRHHEGALPMVDAVLELGSDERTLQLAQSMHDGQSAEIARMQSARARLGCEG